MPQSFRWVGATHRYVWILLTAALISRCATRCWAVEPPVTAVCFSEDGAALVTGSQAGVRYYRWPDLESYEAISTKSRNVRAVSFSASGEKLAIAGGLPAEAGLLEVLDVTTRKQIYLSTVHDDSCTDVAWIGDTRLATAGLDHQVYLHTLGSKERPIELAGHSRGVTTVDSSGATLVSGSIDQNLRVWETQTQQVVRSLNNHTATINQARFLPNSPGVPLLVSASDDRSVRFWQPTIGRMVRFARLEVVPLAVCWLRDGQHVACAAADGSVQLVDSTTATMVWHQQAIEGWAYCIAAHPSGDTLIVGGQHGELVQVRLPPQLGQQP